MKKKIQIGGGGAPVGTGTALDPERVIDPKHVSVYGICTLLSQKWLSEKQTDMQNLLMGSIDGEITYCG
jgi:hypothetical protein